MPNPSRDELCMTVVRAIYGAEDRVKRGELVPPKDDADETRWTLFLGEIVADAILALLASKRESEPAVRTFGPFHATSTTPDGVPFWRVLPAPPIPHPQTAEPDAWMTTTGATTPTPDKPPRQRPVQYRSILSLRESDPEPPTPDTPKEGDEHE